ncbi:hypothetical protein A9K75_09440 [Campylobacter fetus subsp. testudinum]|uniref:hypothetical protein n=1 Tax=Campylobacter fetus TaxID=196 RepID=UPI000818B9FA|nr:hypothetical protein [Campylobacter fetus]OCR98896.1 hypothetical protein A9K75_09440 [Campylobacter fetus subsp. testudinum]
MALLIISVGAVFASDPITIDSFFKQQLGLRSVTSFSVLSSGNPNVYTSYPTLTIQGDPVVWDDTKQASMSETLMYALTDKLDLLTSFSASYIRSEYMSYFTLEPKSETRTEFDSAWVGFNYRADKVGDLVPMITFQTAAYQKERANHESKNFNFKSYSLKGTLKGYTDPVIYSIYTGLGYNMARNFNFAKLKYGNTIFLGGDLSVVLSPKITLDVGIEQRFQSGNKIDGKKTTNIRSIPTYNVGSTYSIDDDTAISVSANFGGSSAAPDSVFGLSIWQKF